MTIVLAVVVVVSRFGGMTYKTAERIFDHKGADSSLPVGTKLVLCSKWYKNGGGRFAMFKAPSFDGVTVCADESQLTQGK